MNATWTSVCIGPASTWAIATLAAMAGSVWPFALLAQTPQAADVAASLSEPWSPPTTVLNSTPPTAGSTLIEELPSPAVAGDAGVKGDDDRLDFDGGTATSVPWWYQPMFWFGPSPSDTGIELGINGSTGTNEAFSLRTGGYIKRESRFSKIDLSLYHNRTTTSGLTTQNNAKLDVRNDWLLDKRSPWTLFAKGTVFYDEFQAYDLQTNANSGIGYLFLDEADIDLIGRVGAGASREFGGPEDDWVPEALFGFEYEQRVTATQKLAYKLDYFPEFEEFGDHRIVTEASWEIEVNKPSNISLKLSATDRYDSTPNGADPHLVNYSVLLLLKL